MRAFLNKQQRCRWIKSRQEPKGDEILLQDGSGILVQKIHTRMRILRYVYAYKSLKKFRNFKVFDLKHYLVCCQRLIYRIHNKLKLCLR